MKKNVFITGCSRGIGNEILKKFSSSEYSIHGMGMKKRKYNNFEYYNVDLSKVSNIYNFKKIIKKLNIDILINNAGINKINYFHKISKNEFNKVFNVNFMSAYHFSQAVIPGMIKKKWGRIINISSIFGEVTKEKRSSYSISKFALKSLTKSLGIEYSKYGILTNSVAPGVVNTDLTKKILTLSDKKDFLNKIPIGKFAEPKDIASLVYWLASTDNKYVTGQHILIDGGYTLI
jgi:3-oxoacyl-[acyl-carrier protein] reductase